MTAPDGPTGFGPKDGVKARKVPAPPGPTPAEAAAEAALRAAYAREHEAHLAQRNGVRAPYVFPARFEGLRAHHDDRGRVLRAARESAWARLARYCLEHAIDPSSYVAAWFRDLLPGQSAPTPGQMMGPSAPAVWERLSRGRGEEVALALRLQKVYARREVGGQLGPGRTGEDAAALVLNRLDLPLSGLFRHCWAWQIGGPRFLLIAQNYLDSAAIQYCRDRDAYREHWATFLPLGFDARAAAIYARRSRRFVGTPELDEEES